MKSKALARINHSLKRIKYWSLYCISELFRRGIFGKRMQTIGVLINVPRCKGRQSYDKDWNIRKRHILDKYDRIEIHRSSKSILIGEIVPLLFNELEAKTQGAYGSTLRVFVLGDYKNYNARVIDIISREMDVITPKNRLFWKDVLNEHPNVDYKNCWRLKNPRSRHYDIISEKYAGYMELNSVEESEVLHKKKQMGLMGKKYVCVSNRDRAWWGDNKAHKKDKNHSSIKDRKKAVDYLLDKGIVAVRMGKVVEEPFVHPGCIDYAFKYWDELMDLALARDAKFWVADASGIMILPCSTNTPVATTNLDVSSLFAWDGFPRSEKNMYIIRREYSKSLGRLLTLNEMLYKSFRKEDDIILINNTQDDILKMVMEINEKIDGKWISSEERKLGINTFEKILVDFRQNNNPDGYQINDGIGWSVAESFIEDNRYLLEKSITIEQSEWIIKEKGLII